MSMLLRRHYNDTVEGATREVAPKPKPTPKPEPEKVEVVEVEETVKEDKPEEKRLTRADIMKMNVATVRAYAEEQGIKGANAMSGAELKRILGDKLFEESEESE
jgi:hypothetical protein